MAPYLSERLVQVSKWILNFLKIMRVTPLFFFFQKECMEKCGIMPTMPGKLADEENDPRRHYHHHPSLSPEAVSSACFITI